MPELVLSIAWHVALGLVLAVVVWLCGLGWLTLTRRPLARDDLVHAYPIGLLTVTLAATVVLLTSWLTPFALTLVGAPLVLLARGDLLLRAAQAAVPALRRVLAPAVGLAAVLGLLLHGPTADLDSRAYGDMLYYVNKISSATQSIAPFRDLLVEGEEIIYAEAAPSFVGAALSWLPPVDPILFHTTSLVAFLCASLAVGCGLLTPVRPRSTGAVVTLGLLATASVIYPTWLVESPPVTMALPLIFSVHRLWTAPPATPVLVGLGVVIAVDLLLTKVVALLVVGILGLFVLAERYRDRLAAIAAGIAVGAAAVVAFLVATAGWYAALLEPGFLPADAAEGLADQLDTRNATALSPAFEVVGQVALLVALARARSFQLLTAATAAVAGVWLIAGQSFDIALATAVLVAALAFWRDPDAFARGRVPLVVAAAAFVIAIWLRDISGVGTALALLALTSAVFLAAFGFERTPVLWALGAAGIAATLVWHGGRLGPRFVALSPDDYELWREVEERVPVDALVFTSMTGKRIVGREGWNHYPSIARRQLYLAGWYDGAWTGEPEKVDRRLEENRRVLAGDLDPEALELSRSYAAHYAVVRRNENAPRTFRLVYRNDSLALYEIP